MCNFITFNISRKIYTKLFLHNYGKSVIVNICNVCRNPCYVLKQNDCSKKYLDTWKRVKFNMLGLGVHKKEEIGIGFV